MTDGDHNPSYEHRSNTSNSLLAHKMAPFGPFAPKRILRAQFRIVVHSVSSRKWQSDFPTSSPQALHHNNLEPEPKEVRKYDMDLQHLFRPASQPNRGQTPTLVLLHGMGGHKTDLMTLGSMLEVHFSVLSLLAPMNLPEGGHSWYGVRFTPEPVIDLEQAEAARLLVIDFLIEAVRRYNLEPRVFLAGFSQGAIIAASVALTRPDLVAGLVMMSGRILPEVKTQAASVGLEQLNVFVAHGRDDQRLPVFHAHETRDLLERLGVKLTFREYANGHEVGTEENRDVTQWLLERVAQT